MFVNLFKPKWRHSSPAVRARAVAQLRIERPAHIDILRQLLLDDASSEVRRAALQRVDDPALLMQVLTSEQDADLRLHAASAIATYLQKAPDQEQQHWLERLAENNSLQILVLCDASNTIQQRALALIDDEPTLASLALQGATAQIRREAAERVTQPEVLENLCRESRGSDKTVHRIARDTLNRYKEQEREQQALRQRRQDLVASLDALVNGLDHQHFQARFDLIVREWEQLPTTDDCDNTFQTLAQQAERFIAQQKAQIEQQEAQKRAAKEHLDACAALEHAIVEQLESADKDDHRSDLAALCEQAEQLSQSGPLGQSLQTQLKLANQYLSALQQIELNREQLLLCADQTAETLEPAKIEKLLRGIRWPESLSKPDLLLNIEQQLKEASKRQQEKLENASKLAAQLEENLRSLERAIEQGEIRVAVRYQDQATDQLQRLNGSANNHLEQRYKSLVAQLQEMKDWQGFAINGKKEALCERMEALIGADIDPQPLADQIRALQQEWKALDANACVHSQKLWQRFRTAAESAYAPCETHFSALRNVREQNLKQREEICRQLSQLLENINWDEADWPAIERICHTAKREWKQFSPVDRAPGKTVQHTFNQLIKTLDHQLRDWHQRCADIKQQLIAQAAELADAEDLRAAAEAAKGLQREWKATGPAFRSEERALWQAFRGHCDTIFARLKEQAGPVTQITLDETPAPMKDADLSTFNSCAEMLNKAEAAVLDGDTGMIEKMLEAVTGSIKSLPARWREGLMARIAVIEQTLESTDELETQLADSESQFRELCIRLEILLGQPTPDDDQAQRMEYQMRRLQQALAEQNQNPSTGDVIELDLEWKTRPYSGVFPQLRRRFERLMQRTGC
ncbi:hypothetical protein ADIMK_0252 [Marinobacterium lacunae]|uniref:DUF349 domain-containing protein n=1 Tax=Marinobacterium lacunae TaxID=1232683 RepID=A0A081G3E0_9GAMM|nr:DUF349 domain-containing protein [Marinobacterium lacunae]KEA65295.1 hypothetical protein ADIMK_0252 [Marinobacterium lacunae]